VHHMGGGWCSSMSSCYERSKTFLGTTRVWNLTYNLSIWGGYFSRVPTVNTLMYNWNKIMLIYCDGGSFAGNNNTRSFFNGTELHFKGYKNLIAYKKDLDLNRNFQKATDVVISGCSAGGLATYLHLDWWREKIRSSTKVVGLPDSGFFLDYAGPPDYPGRMRWVFDQMNCTDGVNIRCIQNARIKSNCYFAEHTAPYIQTPYFVMQSQYDSWQTNNILGSNNSVLINQFGFILKERFLNNVIQNKNNGGFLDSCFHHCWLWDNIIIHQRDINIAFDIYYKTLKPGEVYLQNKPYPCPSCCKGRGIDGDEKNSEQDIEQEDIMLAT